MTYIYDILVNWNEVLYDFYEWNNNDEIMHIRKIPIIKVPTNTLLEISSNNICVNSELLSNIYKKAETFTSKNIKTLDYVTLFSDGESVIALMFDETGISTLRSKLLIDEEDDTLETVIRMKEINIDYNIINKIKIDFKTRKEKERNNYLEKEINNLKLENSLEKLKYLYLECFNEKCDNKNKMIKKLESLLKNNSEKTEKLEQFFKMTNTNK